jgi:hypothetical protein
MQGHAVARLARIHGMKIYEPLVALGQSSTAACVLVLQDGSYALPQVRLLKGSTLGHLGQFVWTMPNLGVQMHGIGLQCYPLESDVKVLEIPRLDKLSDDKFAIMLFSARSYWGNLETDTLLVPTSEHGNLAGCIDGEPLGTFSDLHSTYYALTGEQAEAFWFEMSFQPKTPKD